MKKSSKKSVVKKAAKKVEPIVAVGKLFGRCLTLQSAEQIFNVKVMGDRGEAAVLREKLIAALAAAGIEVMESDENEEDDDAA